MQILAILAAVVLTALGRAPLSPHPLHDVQQALSFIETPRFDAALSALGLPHGPNDFYGVTVGEVTIPRHLDGMAFYQNGVQVLHDVRIPANTRGWKLMHYVRSVDHYTMDRYTFLYMPEVCGNLSVIRVTPHPHDSVPVWRAEKPLPPPGPVPTLIPLAPPAVTEPPAPTVTHRTPWWLALALIPVAFIGGSHHDSPDVGIIPRPSPTWRPLPTPTPTYTTIPRPTPTFTPLPTPTPHPTPTPKPSATPCATKKP